MSPCSVLVSRRQRKAEDFRMEREAMNRNNKGFDDVKYILKQTPKARVYHNVNQTCIR